MVKPAFKPSIPSDLEEQRVCLLPYPKFQGDFN